MKVPPQGGLSFDSARHNLSRYGQFGWAIVPSGISHQAIKIVEVAKMRTKRVQPFEAGFFGLSDDATKKMGLTGADDNS